MRDKEEKKEYDIALEMANHSSIQVEGEAASQILQAYEGVRYDSLGKDLNHRGRSLKRIKEYTINDDPVYAKNNIKQQSGFDAELIHETRENKNSIRNGSKKRIRTTDGIGMTNDTQYDHVVIGDDGKVVKDSGSQMKFYGTKEKNGAITYKVIDKLVFDDSWDRYDGYVDIPSEQFDGAKKYAEQQAEKLRKQAKKLKQRGEEEKAVDLKKKADRYNNASKKIRKSRVSTDEAIEARLSPELFVAKEFIGDVHHGGLESAKGSIVFSSIMSGTINIYDYASGDKSASKAVVDTVKNTAEAGLVGYGVGAAGTSIKALMHSSKNELIRKCGNTSLPTAIASGVVETSKSLKKYATGDISEKELVEELGEKGVGMMASGYGATVGAMAGSAIGSVVPVVGNIAGAAIGSFVGSMVGCAVSGTLYRGAIDSLKAVEMSDKRRREIESIAKQAIRENDRYIDELNEYLNSIQEGFRNDTLQILNDMQTCILNADVNGYANSIMRFGNKYGLKLEYETFEEFDDAMKSDVCLLL